MKTNYAVLWLNFVISIFMLFSLNSFSDSNMCLPALFLYFLSNVGVYFEKYLSCKDNNLTYEKSISCLCLVLCFCVVTAWIAHYLGFIEITLHNSSGSYRILVQGVANSFVSFTSKDITQEIFLISSLFPLTYPLFISISYLRELGFTKQRIIKIFLHKYKNIVILFFLSLTLGFLAMTFCYLKYSKTYNGYGNPQYFTYFFLTFILSFPIFLYLFILHHKDHEL